MNKSVSGLGRRVEKRRARKVEFLDAAAIVLARDGLRDATMAAVASEAGVSKAVVYRYFASRDDLVEAVLERSKQQLLEADRLPWAGYGAALRRCLDIAWRNPSAFLLLLRDSRDDPAFSHHFDELWHSVSHRLTGAFEDLGVDPEHAEWSGEAAADFTINALARWVARDLPGQDEAFIDWASAGTHALDRQWRKQFGKPVATVDQTAGGMQ